MRRLSTGKRAASWVLVAAIGVVGSYSRAAYAASLEDSQQAAGAIVTKARTLAEVQAARSKAAQEGEKTNEPGGTLNALISDCSADTQREFLGSLVLVTGELSSAHVARIETCLDNARYAQVLRFFGAGVAIQQ